MTENVFVDANVLIYLFWPTGSHTWEQRYASTFRNLLRQGNQLFIDFMIISEVINRVIKIEHQKINPSQKFKDFRDSAEGRDALSDIYTIVRDEVLTNFEVVENSMDKQAVENCLLIDELDFVDKSTVSLCKRQSFVLLTNDRDFKNSDLDVLTGNPAILN